MDRNHHHLRQAALVALITLLSPMAGMLPAAAQHYQPLQMGVNVNERPHWLKAELLQRSQTTWVRAFIEASHYIRGDRSLADDFRMEALERVAGEGYKVMLSIKWNLKEAGWRVPPPGSEREQQWLAFAGRLLQRLDGDLSALVLVNEITIDTPEADLQPDSSGTIPFVRFQKRLLDYLDSRLPRTPEGEALPVYTGGFTRLDKPELQDHPANRAMFRWINTDDRLAGADFHMHQPDYQTSREAADFIRLQIPDKPLVVTEFSLIWKWKAHLGDPIGAADEGRAFARKYNRDPAMTVAEYTTAAFSNPVTQTEWQAFMESQPWFEPLYLDVMGRLMERHGVVIATYAFTQNPDTDDPWTITTRHDPWFIQQLFMPRSAAAPEGETAVNYGLFESFRRWQAVSGKLLQTSVEQQ